MRVKWDRGTVRLGGGCRGGPGGDEGMMGSGGKKGVGEAREG